MIRERDKEQKDKDMMIQFSVQPKKRGRKGFKRKRVVLRREGGSGKKLIGIEGRWEKKEV